MVLFTVELEISVTIQEQNEMDLDNIYSDHIANGTKLYKMYDRICQASEAIAKVLNQTKFIPILSKMLESAASVITNHALTDAGSLRAGENAPDSPSSYSFLRVPHYP